MFYIKVLVIIFKKKKKNDLKTHIFIFALLAIGSLVEFEHVSNLKNLKFKSVFFYTFHSWNQFSNFLDFRT